MYSEISDLARQIVEISTDKGLKIGFAESLTGGMIASEIVSVPGASSCFEGSVVSYSNEVKINVLNVDAEVIKSYGAVSEQCAKQMASGARKLLGADYSVSVTGIAGPAGGSDKKPVGTVYIGFSGGDDTFAEHFLFEGDRESIRLQTVKEAYKLLLKYIV